MRRMSFAAAVLAFAGLVGLAPIGPAGAQQAHPDLDVSPAVGQLATVPGRTVEETITVVNLSGDDFSVTAALEDLNVDRLGRASSRPAGESANSAAPWGFVEPPSFLLPSGHSQTVQVSLTPPKDATPGGYSAAVRLLGQRGSAGMASALHSVLVDVGGSGIVHSARLAGVFVPSRAYGSTFPVTVVLENQGTTHIVATGTIVVRDVLSRVTARVSMPKTVVLRGHTRLVTVRAPSPLVPWQMTVQASVSFSDGVPGGTAGARGFAIAYWSLAVVALLLLLVLWEVYRLVRRRLRRRAARRTPIVLPEGVAVAHGHSGKPVEAYSGIPGVEDELQAWWAEPESAAGTLGLESEDEPLPAKVGSAPPAGGPEPRPLVVVAEREPEAPAARAADLEPDEDRVPVRLRLTDPEPALADEAETEKVGADDEQPGEVIEPAKPSRPALVLATLPEPAPAFPAEDEPASAAEEEAVPPEPKVPVREEAPVAPTPAPAPAAEAVPVAAPEPEVERELEPVGAAAASPGGDRVARLQSSTRRKLATAPARGLTAHATARRVELATGMLVTGAGRSGERVGVALDLLRTIRTEPAVAKTVEKAYADALARKDGEAVAPLALALDLLQSPRAAEALLGAYASPPASLTEQLEAALRGRDPADLRRHRTLVAALPKGRRASLNLD